MEPHELRKDPLDGQALVLGLDDLAGQHVEERHWLAEPAGLHVVAEPLTDQAEQAAQLPRSARVLKVRAEERVERVQEVVVQLAAEPAALLFVGERARRGREFELGAVQFLGQQPQVLAAPPDQHRDDDESADRDDRVHVTEIARLPGEDERYVRADDRGPAGQQAGRRYTAQRSRGELLGRQVEQRRGQHVPVRRGQQDRRAEQREHGRGQLDGRGGTPAVLAQRCQPANVPGGLADQRGQQHEGQDGMP